MLIKTELEMLKMIKNPDTEKYEEITKAIKECNGYCCCLIARNEDTKCMCKEFREQNTPGLCRCGRFMKVEE